MIGSIETKKFERITIANTTRDEIIIVLCDLFEKLITLSGDSPLSLIMRTARSRTTNAGKIWFTRFIPIPGASFPTQSSSTQTSSLSGG
jgi:hypothetical protein